MYVIHLPPFGGDGVPPNETTGLGKRLRVGPAMAEILAPVTGTVWKVETKEGAEVAEGQILFVLESMKMEIPVEATEAGRVKKVHVAPGEAVDEGTALATLE